MSNAQLDALIAGSLDAQGIAMRLAESMTPEQYAAPSALPDWSRAHVIAHLVGNTLAQTRQVEYAVRGETVDVYTGGQQARDNDIEERATIAAAELTDLLRDAHASWEAVVAQVDDDVAHRPVTFRDGVVADVISGRWFESLVHAVDLGLTDDPAYTCRDWSPEFSVLLANYLAERLPHGQQVRLEATDADFDELYGDGTQVHLRGQIADIAGFLADRGPLANLESLAAPVSELAPYPRGSIQK